MKFQIPKGLFDILPYGGKYKWQISELWQHVESQIHKIAKDYSYRELRTPIFERTELFNHGIGEATDIISKEMYTFLDRAGRSMSLRPEGTAGALRSFIEKNLAPLRKIHKFYYLGPMFRYERPQAGRYRQHYQFGVEVIGNPSIYQDVEIIDMLYTLYEKLNIKNVSVNINSIGNEATRANYKKALQNYLFPFLDKLSKESQERFYKNPLRILDSKAINDQKILKQAPSILDFLDKREKEDLDNLCLLLKKINIPTQINPFLVRGLDYYTNIVFEITYKNLGAQNALSAGGRYDQLLANLGGPNLPGCGFGAGMERILQTMIEQNIKIPPPPSPSAYFIPLNDMAKEICFLYTTKLRHLGISSDMEISFKKIQRSLQNAVKLKVRYCVIIGEEEIKAKKIKIKDMESHQQEEIEEHKFLEHFQNLSKHRENINE